MAIMKLPRPRPTLYTFIPKPVVKVLVGVLLLVVLLVGGGAAYTWYMGRNTPAAEPPAVEGTSDIKKKPFFEPSKPAANANVGVSVQSLTSPVAPGENASITIRTLPGAECTITVEYNKVKSTDSGLVAKVADEYGMVDWTWTVDASAPKGKWPVDVTCSRGEKSGMVRGDLEVVKP